MRGRTKYLFGERGSPYEITLILRERLNKELANLTPDVLLQSSPDAVIDDIVHRTPLTFQFLTKRTLANTNPLLSSLRSRRTASMDSLPGPDRIL